jgi:hypothetical protein
LIGNLFRQQLTTRHVANHLSALSRRESVEGEQPHMGAADPRRRELRPESKTTSTRKVAIRSTSRSRDSRVVGSLFPPLSIPRVTAFVS